LSNVNFAKIRTCALSLPPYEFFGLEHSEFDEYCGATMKIGIQTWGSDGDILPFLALAEGLQKAGHMVTLAYTSVDDKDYSDVATRAGIHALKVFERFGIDPDEAMAEIVRTNDPLKQVILVMQRFFDPALEAMYQASRELCAHNDIVIGHMMNHTLLTAAQKQNIPRAVVVLAPLAIRTKYIPLFGPNLGTISNLLTWKLGDFVSKKKLFVKAEDLRVREGLPRLKSTQEQLYVSHDLTLIACSSVLVVRRPDWGQHIQICGDLRSQSVQQYMPVDEGMASFLKAGVPPVYITFGSFIPFENAKLDQLITKAVDVAGCRAIFQSGTDAKCSPNLFKCSKAPHATVFPQCAAIVHHGGAGTTHSALRAGKPSVVVEHAFDQLFWGKELQKRGAGGEVLHRNTLTAEKLARAIAHTLASAPMEKKAVELGLAMRREDGVLNAVGLIEKKFAQRNA
jgi:UDP:flavonoid glycosyltransferase YjiC (YdhE family)